MKTFEYIIVGGGTAGCVLASRLSENPGVRVLLIEAGRADGPPAMANPSARGSLLGSEVDWAFTTTPQAGLGETEVAYPAGKVLGGSSAINAMFHLRGHSSNYDAWAEAGATGWSYEELLPYLMRSEQSHEGDPRVRGISGPMLVGPMPHSLLVEALHTAAAAVGYPDTADVNGAAQEGVGRPEWNIVDGKRQSAADAYLRPVLNRHNLTVTTDARVERLIIDNGRCRGVEYTVGAESLSAEAAYEVVLSAGAIGSAQLLLVSGVGPAAQLREFDIDIVVDAPQVGENLQDHPMSSVVFSASESALPVVRGEAHSALVALLRSSDAAPEPDIQLTLLDAPYFSPALSGSRDAFAIGCSLMKPFSRGYVRLAGNDIGTPPLINPNYYADSRDIDRMIVALGIARSIGGGKALAEWSAGEQYPGTDMPLIDYMRISTMPYCHPVGTCRMGSDPESVVDVDLRVRGVDGLRIADASVMPSIVSANTNATVLAIAERAADLISAAHAMH